MRAGPIEKPYFNSSTGITGRGHDLATPTGLNGAFRQPATRLHSRGSVRGSHGTQGGFSNPFHRPLHWWQTFNGNLVHTNPVVGLTNYYRYCLGVLQTPARLGQHNRIFLPKPAVAITASRWRHQVAWAELGE